MKFFAKLYDSFECFVLFTNIGSIFFIVLMLCGWWKLGEIIWFIFKHIAIV